MFRTKRLTEKEKSIIPYKPNQVLVFESNKSEIDTIIITEITLKEHPPYMEDMLWAKNKEILRIQTDVDCKNCDEIITLAKRNYSIETEITWTIRINGKNYVYGTNLKSINRLKKKKLTLNEIEYDDVLVLKRRERFKRPNNKLSKMFYDEIYPIDKLYWSKSKGIMKFEIIETNEIWKLKTHYNTS